MRAWLAVSGLFTGITLGAAAPGLVGCYSCPYEPPAVRTYTIIDSPVPAFLGGKAQVTQESSELVIRYDWDGQESELVYHLIY